MKPIKNNYIKNYFNLNFQVYGFIRIITKHIITKHISYKTYVTKYISYKMYKLQKIQNTKDIITKSIKEENYKQFVHLNISFRVFFGSFSGSFELFLCLSTLEYELIRTFYIFCNIYPSKDCVIISFVLYILYLYHM